MEENRKGIIIGGIGFLALMGFIGILIFALNPITVLSNLSSGALFGIGTSFFTCWYLRRVWDPTTLTGKGVNERQEVSYRWLPIVVIGSVVGGRILSTIQSVFIDWLVAYTLMIIAISMGFMAFQAWRHRPRS